MNSGRTVRKSLAWHVAILYLLMNLASIAFFTYVIGSQQSGLLVDLTRYQAKELMEGLSADLDSADLPTARTMLDSLAQNFGHRYWLVASNDSVLASSQPVPLPADYRVHAVQATMQRAFSGRSLILQLDGDSQEMRFYLPLRVAQHDDCMLLFVMDMKPIGGQIRGLGSLVVLAVLVLSALHLVFALLVLQWIVKPIRRLWDATARVAAGDWNHRVALSRTDEIGGLAQGFDEMLDVIRDAYRRIEKMAVTDALTGLYNRRFFMDRLSQELQASAHREPNMCVLIFDVDHFKKINDTLGHATGDLVLVRLARTLQESLPADAILARYGGEEFVVLQAQAGSADVAKAMAERIREAASAMKFDAEGHPSLQVTISIGLVMQASMGALATNGDELLKSADAALYVAKNLGRNRVVSFGEF